MQRSTLFAWPHLPLAYLRNACAALLAAALHLLLGALLLANWAVDTPPAPSVRTISMQLLSLPTPTVPVEVPQPSAAPAPEVRAAPEPQVDSRREQRKIEQAALAHKRVEQQQRQRAEQARLEQTRLAEQQLKQQQQQRQAAEQLAVQQRQQAVSAAAEQARQAEALAAASHQYLPIAKQAPDYPQRALDKGIQGECTVSYRVNAQGRVEDPQVVGDCHPLFIRPSLNAAKSFRYQPRVVDGQAVAVPNVKNTFSYRIE